jgi:hypothetical protein
MRKLPFAQLGGELSVTDRFGMYSGPTRLLMVMAGLARRGHSALKSQSQQAVWSFRSPSEAGRQQMAVMHRPGL